MKNIFTIPEKYLIFRDQARNLKNTILKKTDLKKTEKNKNKVIFLDFSKVVFISRSFADEFLNIISELMKNKISVRIINQSPNIKIFLNIIKKTKEKIKKEII